MRALRPHGPWVERLWLRLLALLAVVLVPLLGAGAASATCLPGIESGVGAYALPGQGSARWQLPTPPTGTTYDDPAALVSDAHVADAVFEWSRGDGGHLLSFERSDVAAKTARKATRSGDELVNLASDARTTHILQGDATGGGHLWPGSPGKTPFPQSWSGDRVMHEISDVATDPGSAITPGRGGSTVVTGTRDGVDIRVILRGGDIITGHPTNLPRNP